LKEFEIKRAELKNLDEIAKIFDEYREFYEKKSDLNGAREFLFDRFVNFQSIIFIAYDNQNEKIAGFTQLYPVFSSLSMGRALILNDLFVREEYRKRGVAKSILQYVKDYASTYKLKGVELSTAITNKKAQSLYESFGFKRDEEFYHYYLSV
jgi:ribosomal protein S18 acetylase RimI-like enzyme